MSQPLGPGTVAASFAEDGFYEASSDAESTLVYALAAGGSFVIGDRSATGAVTFWGSQWAKVNGLSGGRPPSSFNGFQAGAAPTCGAPWASGPGNSVGSPRAVPSYMAVIVSSSVTRSGSTISGDVVHVVVVKTDAGYAADPSHAGTGTVVATIC